MSLPTPSKFNKAGAVKTKGHGAGTKTAKKRPAGRVSEKSKLDLAGQMNTRVLIVRAPETHDLLNMAAAADKAAHRIRFNGNPGALVNFYSALEVLEAAVIELCNAADLPYDVVRRVGVGARRS